MFEEEKQSENEERIEKIKLMVTVMVVAAVMVM